MTFEPHKLLSTKEVCLLIHASSSVTTAAITEHLKCNPSEVEEMPVTVIKCEEPYPREDRLNHLWKLHSPISSEEANASNRLIALIEIIRPFSERLVSLDASCSRSISIVYSFGYRGPIEFDWFTLPPATLRMIGEWNLNFSYETFWFDHHEPKSPSKGWRKWISKLRGRSE